MNTKEAAIDAARMAYYHPVETAKLNESGKAVADDLREGKLSSHNLATLFLDSLGFVAKLNK